MTWPAQLRHVFVKDLTEQRRLLFVYVVIVAIATLHGLGWQPVARAGFGFTMVLLGLAGATLVGGAVQADSPTRSDAFWASHPFSRSAMWVAKLCFALGVLAVAVAGQLIVLRSFDIHGLDAFARATTAALFYGALILIALVVAALTRDLRSFGLGIVLVPVLLFVISASSALARLQIHVPGAAINPLKWIAALVQIGVFAWLYHHPDARRRARLGGYAFCVLAVSALAFESPSPSVQRLAADPPRAALTLERPANGELLDRFGLALNLALGTRQQGLRYTLLGPVASVRLRDGSVLHVPMSSATWDLGFGETLTLPRDAGLRWIGPEGATERRILLNAPLTSAQRSRIEAGVEAITVEGRMIVSEAFQIATMPLREGAELTRAGLWLHLDSWAHARGEPALTVHSRRVASDESERALLGWSERTRYALVNPSRREALGLSSLQSGSSIDGMVLPASTLVTESGQYERAGVILDDAWLRGAELMLIGEKPLGSYQLRVELNK